VLVVIDPTLHDSNLQIAVPAPAAIAALSVCSANLAVGGGRYWASAALGTQTRPAWDDDRTGSVEKSREAVRWIIVALLVAAIGVSATVRIPTRASGSDQIVDLPDVALGQPAIYRLELFLMAFYGGLLIATPVYRAVIDGHLPIEISARGAKFAEETAGSINRIETTVDELRDRLLETEVKTTRNDVNIDQLAEEIRTRPPE
jgi:hypothetical protein